MKSSVVHGRGKGMDIIKAYEILTKIFSSKENIARFIAELLKESIKERCEKYNHPYGEKKLNYLMNATADFLAKRHYNCLSMNYSFSSILSECNKDDSWDHPGSILRTTAGIEEMLLIIEPAEEFARLHEGYLKTVDEDYLDQFNLRQYLK